MRAHIGHVKDTDVVQTICFIFALLFDLASQKEYKLFG